MNCIEDRWLTDHTVRNNELQAHRHFTCTCAGCSTVAPAGGPAMTPAQMDSLERNTPGMYWATLLAPAPTLTGPNLTTHIDRLHTFIRMLTTWGKWDEVLSQSCLVLGELHLRQSNYRKAVLAAHAGLLVEQHLYTHRYTNELNVVLSTCYVQDLLLRDEYNRASQGPYPLS
ncbi:hypothetical protein CC86DRAFT_351459 [Ophiobolus disseminans]|uniref:Uncharacterized protein n=1 Tax=Ophiobolus disseminans TaxID=1469910 RepID=A0A6A6ZX47_9PLEO|nr:hypothetical protein CC86DRAFT_351459 [Ophiobolus disseminans]